MIWMMVQKRLWKRILACRNKDPSMAVRVGRLSFKYKMAIFQTKLTGLRCDEVTINWNKCRAVMNVKKPRGLEVNYCPQHPKRETNEGLEKERIARLPEITKRNNDHIVTVKMEKIFSYTKQEVLPGEPWVADFKSRWSALFTVKELHVLYVPRVFVICMHTHITGR